MSRRRHEGGESNIMLDEAEDTLVKQFYNRRLSKKLTNESRRKSASAYMMVE